MTDPNDGAMAGEMVRTALTASVPELFIGEQPSSLHLEHPPHDRRSDRKNANNDYSTAEVNPYLKIIRGGNTDRQVITPPTMSIGTSCQGQQYNNLPDTLYVGLAASSRSGMLSTATFANTAITSPNKTMPRRLWLTRLAAVNTILSMMPLAAMSIRPPGR